MLTDVNQNIKILVPFLGRLVMCSFDFNIALLRKVLSVKFYILKMF